MTLTQWEEFRARFPNRSQKIKELGAEIYALGAEDKRTDDKLTELEALMKSLPPEELKQFGLSESFSKGQLMVTVIELGRQMILNLERGAR